MRRYNLEMRWIASARFDLAFLLGPPLAAVALVLAVPAFRTGDVPLWGWLLFVVAIDVAHVYASLYRTYLDPVEFARRRALYVAVPLLCLAVGVMLYSLGPAVFWRVLAYVAVLHFVRQQFGFVMLYRHRAGERGRWDARIDKAAIYATMLYPLVFWHADPGRDFAWFVKGDFVSFPAWTSAAGVVLYSAALLLFAGKEAVLSRRRPVNWGKIGIVVATAATWYVGIVFLNSDIAFTVTNVVAHGIPYMALVWLYGRRKWEGGWRRRVHQPVLFVGLLLALAYAEEFLWDLFVWKEHAAAFGGLALGMPVPAAVMTLLVPLLMLPQATHYVLDAFLWKFDGSNPGLRYYLFGEGPRPAGETAAPGGIPLEKPA